MIVMKDVAIVKSEFMQGEKAVTKIQDFQHDDVMFEYCSLPEVSLSQQNAVEVSFTVTLGYFNEMYLDSRLPIRVNPQRLGLSHFVQDISVETPLCTEYVGMTGNPSTLTSIPN